MVFFAGEVCPDAGTTILYWKVDFEIANDVIRSIGSHVPKLCFAGTRAGSSP
jgi:hypothetical protein